MPSIMFGAQMGLQGFSGYQQQKANMAAMEAQTNETIANIENLKLQEAISDEATAATDTDMEVAKGQFLETQRSAIVKSGFSGGATAEALKDETNINLNAEARKVRFKGQMMSMTMRQRQKGTLRRGLSVLSGIKSKSTGDLFGTIGGVLGTGGQMASWEAKKSTLTPSGGIPTYSPW